MTVVFDAGQNCGDNFARLAGTGLHYIGSVPASDCPDLTALPAAARIVAGQQRFGALTAFGTRRVVYGTERRAILTHSPELHAAQARGFEGTILAKAGRKLDELAATLARGTTPPQQGQGGSRDHRDHGQALGPPRHHLAAGRRAAQGPAPGLGHRHRCPRAALEEEIFGKHVLITSHDHWPAAEVIAGYRSQSVAGFSFRQLKDPQLVSLSPMSHWTGHNIRVRVFTCVLALQIARLMRLRARRSGLDLSVRELLGELAGIGETVLPTRPGGPAASAGAELISRRLAVACACPDGWPVRPVPAASAAGAKRRLRHGSSGGSFVPWCRVAKWHPPLTALASSCPHYRWAGCSLRWPSPGGPGRRPEGDRGA